MGRPGESGLTLIEMLISVALLGFILISIAPLFIAAVKSNYSANEYTSVNMLARDRLEQVMNLNFSDPNLTPGIYANDQAAFLPLPTDPTTLSTVLNPFTITYQVTQWSIPSAVVTGDPFTPTQVIAANQVFHYKRIDVTVTAHQIGASPLAVGTSGIGLRVARVAGFLSNPSPAKDLSECGTVSVTCSVDDPCVLGGDPPCHPGP